MRPIVEGVETQFLNEMRPNFGDCVSQVMVVRDSWEHSYLIVRGEILRFVLQTNNCESICHGCFH